MAFGVWLLATALTVHLPPARLSPPRLCATPPPPAKTALLEAIAAFHEATAADGLPSVDFGVQGGELDGDTRAPRDLYAAGAYHAVSTRVGEAADNVLSSVNALAEVNPTDVPTEGLGTAAGASVCPLHGSWSNVFTTAADAVFSPDSKRGAADVFNVVDAANGRITNCIDFMPRDHPAFRATRQRGKPPSPVENLRVQLSSSAVSAKRVELVFRYVRVQLNKFFGLPLRIALTIPVPGPFFTRLLFLFRPKKRPPPAYFDVLYIDDDLRVHRTGQGNVFVQKRRPLTA